MIGSEVFRALREKGVETLYHANTVTTSCTFLQLGGLASRACVENRQLPQTAQGSDYLDKKFGIWNDIFTDGVDLHRRGKMRNDYGPVLFALPATILLRLPPETEVLVTRENPIHWKDGQDVVDRYVMSIEELVQSYSYGDFGKHVVFRNRNGLLPFNDATSLFLDDPQSALGNGLDAYTSAVERLRRAAAERNVRITITRRECGVGCKCRSGRHNSYDGTNLNFYF